MYNAADNDRQRRPMLDLENIKNLTDELKVDSFLTCLIEIVVIFFLMLLIFPFFETLNPFWYGLILAVAPVSVSGEVVRLVAKLRNETLKTLASSDFNAPLELASKDKPVKRNEWEYFDGGALFFSVFLGAFASLIYYLSAKTFIDLMLLGAVLGVGVFAIAQNCLTRLLPDVIDDTIRLHYAKGDYSEEQTVDYLIRFYVLPWGAHALLLLSIFCAKQFFGHLALSGEIRLSDQAYYVYVSCLLISFWYAYYCTPSLRNASRLGFIKLEDVGNFNSNDFYGLLFLGATLPWLTVVFLDVFGFDLILNVWQALTLDILLICYSVILGIFASALLEQAKLSQST